MGSVHDYWIFAGMLLYFLTMTLMISSPWLPSAPGFTFSESIVWASIPLLIGLVRYTATSITTGFVLAAFGPYNQTTVILAFILGCILGIITLWNYRTRLKELVISVFVERGFYFLVALVAYIVIIWLLRLGDSTDKWSFLALASSLLTVPFVAYSLSYLPWNRVEIRNTARLLLLTGSALIVVALVYPLICGRYEQYSQAFFVLYKTVSVFAHLPVSMDWVDPDFNRVSFSSSHYFAVAMLLLSVAALYAGHIGKRLKGYYLLGFLALYCFALGENAHIIPGALAGFAALGLLVFSRKGVLGSGTSAVLVTLFTVAATLALIGVLYFPDGRYSLSQKASIYRHTLERIQENPVRSFFGEGPSAYASRAANKRYSDAVLEIEYSFPFAITDFTSPSFAAVIQESVTYEGGSTMKRPLSGAAGFFVEWGIFGTLLGLFIVYRLLRRAIKTYTDSEHIEARVISAIAVFGMVLLGVSLSVRTYFEYTELTSLVSVLLMLAVSAGSNNRQNADEEVMET
jgi:hypothetical protein